MRFVMFLVLLIVLAGCNSSQEAQLSSSQDRERIAQHTRETNHDHTVDESTKKDYSNFEVLKKKALKDAKFVNTLTEKELQFAKKIRPLHFDLKTMILRMTGTGILYLSGETDEKAVVKMSEEANEKLYDIETKLNKLQAPKSMEHVLTVYLKSINMYEESIDFFQQYFKTDNPDFLNEFRNLSDQASAQIKNVIYEMWRDELVPN
jgi:hypothetical protein